MWRSWWSDDSKWKTRTSWSQHKWRETQSQSHFSRFSFNLRGSATEDGSLPVNDGGCKQKAVHNGTRPTFARSRLKTEASKVSLCSVKSHSQSLRFASIACVDTLMRYTDTLNTDTTLDIDDTQATVSDCNNPSAHARSKKHVWLFCRTGLSYTVDTGARS